MNNLSDALRTALEPYRRVMTQAARASQDVDLREPLTTDQVMATPTPTAKQRNRERRHGLYKQVKALVDGGMSQSDAARQHEINLRTVQRWIQAGVFPERTPRCYPHSVDAYASYLDQRLLQGCRNVSQLWRELTQHGYRGQISSVWHWLRKHQGHAKQNSLKNRAKPIVHASPRHTAWQILKETASAKPYLDELYRASPKIAQLAHLGKEFFRIVRCRDPAAWPTWLEDAQYTALSRFVSGITRDRDAVEVALSAVEQRPGRGTCPSAQADQTADVRTRQLRSAKTALLQKA